VKRGIDLLKRAHARTGKIKQLAQPRPLAAGADRDRRRMLPAEAAPNPES
jgi:hypothetical protein